MSLTHSNTNFSLINKLYGITLNQSKVNYVIKSYELISNLIEQDIAKGQQHKITYIDTLDPLNSDDDLEYLRVYFNADKDGKYIVTVEYDQLKELYNYINSQLTRITEYVTKYKSYGKKVTSETKLYDLIEYLNLKENAQHAKHAQTNINTKEVAKELYNNIINYSNIDTDNTKNKQPTPRQMINADRVKKAVKRNNNQ